MIGAEMTRTDYFNIENEKLRWSHLTDTAGDLNIMLDWGNGPIEQIPVPGLNFWLPECVV